jgi:hypothetical protein
VTEDLPVIVSNDGVSVAFVVEMTVGAKRYSKLLVPELVVGDGCRNWLEYYQVG